MLPKITSALSKFVNPVASSQNEGKVDSDSEDRRFKKFDAPQKKSPQKQGNQQNPSNDSKKPIPLRIVKADSPEALEALTPQKDPRPEIAPGALLEKSVSQSFLQLFNSFQKRGRSTLMKWLGTRSYEAATLRQKQKSRIPKGTMMDRKVE